MNENQAFDVLKQIVDVAVKRGLFENIEATAAATEALKVISEKINANDQTNAQ